MTSPTGHEFVFVAGMHRSGTTLLGRLIDSSAEASGLRDTGVMMDEGQFLQDVYPTGKMMGGFDRWADDPRAHLTEADAAAIPDAAGRLWRSWSPYWDLERRYLVEKTPLNLTRTRFLQALFPGAKFVVITRHPLVQALAVHKWARLRHQRLGIGLDALVRQWVLAHEAFEADREHLDHVHVVRYEHLVADPAPEAARLQEFLGFDIDTDLLADLDRGRAQEYSRMWERATAPGARGAAARRLAPAVRRPQRERVAALRALTETLAFPRAARRVRTTYGERIARLGYDERLDHAGPVT